MNKKELIDKELELYKREKILEINEELHYVKNALIDDWSEIEHNYHSKKEAKNAEILKLDALIEAKNDILKKDSDMCNFLKEMIDKIVTNQRMDVTQNVSS